jgi:hypothetical protein
MDSYLALRFLMPLPCILLFPFLFPHRFINGEHFRNIGIQVDVLAILALVILHDSSANRESIFIGKQSTTSPPPHHHHWTESCLKRFYKRQQLFYSFHYGMIFIKFIPGTLVQLFKCCIKT